MTLDDDIRLVVRSLFVGIKTVIVEPISQEWLVRGERTKHGMKIDIQYPKKVRPKPINTQDAIQPPYTGKRKSQEGDTYTANRN